MRQLDPTTPFISLEERSENIFDAAETFHEASKNRQYGSFGSGEASANDRLVQLAHGERALRIGYTYQQIKNAVRRTRTASMKPLPLALNDLKVDLSELILNRKSGRTFGAQPVTLAELGALLRLTYGIGRGCLDGDREFRRRTCPSSGGLYGLELYVAVDRVEGLQPGLYHYETASHELALLSREVGAATIAGLCVQGPPVSEPALVVVFTAVIERLRWKYGLRAYRLALLDAGHAAQQMALVGSAQGLESCAVQAFVDDDVAGVLGNDGLSEMPVHMLFVGRPASGDDHFSQGPAGSKRDPVRGIGPIIRYNVELDPTCPRDAWIPFDESMRAAFKALSTGRMTEARERLLALEALLPHDETVRDYLKLADGEPARFEANGSVLMTCPETWPVAECQRWSTLLAEVALEVAKWVGVEQFPATYIDLRYSPAYPMAHVRGRRIQRKLTFHERVTREEIMHEMVHAILAPENLMIAEGLAALVSTTPTELADVETELARDTTPPIDVEKFFGPMAGTARESALKRPNVLLYPVGASFVAHLIGAFGRARFFAFTDALAIGVADHITGQADTFAEVYGVSLQSEIAAWWSALRDRAGRDG